MNLQTQLGLVTLWVPAAFCSNGPAGARVNGEEISQLRLERYFAEYLEDQGRALGSIRNPKAYKQLRKAALDALIDKLGTGKRRRETFDATRLGDVPDHFRWMKSPAAVAAVVAEWAQMRPAPAEPA